MFNEYKLLVSISIVVFIITGVDGQDYQERFDVSEELSKGDTLNILYNPNDMDEAILKN